MDTLSPAAMYRAALPCRMHRAASVCAIDPLKAKVLLRTYRDTDGQFVPSDFYDDDDDD